MSSTPTTTPAWTIFPYAVAILFLWLGGWGLLEMCVDYFATLKSMCSVGTEVTEAQQRSRRWAAYLAILVVGILLAVLVWSLAGATVI